MLNYSAIVPKSWKQGLIFTLLNRAKKICSSVELFNVEVNKLKYLFSCNGYPDSFFFKVLDKFTNRTSLNDLEESVSDKVMLKLPFLGEVSYELGKKLKSIIDNTFGVNVRVVYTLGLSVKSKINCANRHSFFLM